MGAEEDKSTIVEMPVIRHDPGAWVWTETTRKNGWHVVTHWYEVDDQLIPAGLEVRSFAEDDDGRAPGPGSKPFLASDTPLGVTAEAVAGLRLGSVLREHRREAWRQLRARASQVEESFPEGASDWHRLADRAVAATARPSPRDALYRRVAQLYQEAQDLGDHAPAEAVRVGLELDAVKFGIEAQLDPDRDEHNKRTRVRKWIGEARRRGYLPPVERKDSK